MGSREFDVVVIGGGITGAGCALDAASRGLRTALVERGDFASGTSSKSSKMVHGGLRYLQQREFRLVYEALRERHRLLRNAPHLVRVVPHLLPMFGKDGILPKQLVRAFGSALWFYDLTGGWRIGRRHKRVSKDEALELAPTLNGEHLVSGYLYYDCLTDDARLTLAIARTAAERHGATVANYAEVTGIGKDAAGRVNAVTVHADGRDIQIKTRSIISATGVWADRIHELESGVESDTMRPAKGIHVTVPWEKVPIEIAVSGLGTGDKRSMFVVPWGDLAYLGTTDTDYDGPLDDPQCTPEDIDYLLRGHNRWFTEALTPSDVTGTWAGLRPLVKGETNERTADLSRRHATTATDSGVVTISGGKLTTYREMASDAVDALVDGFDQPPDSWKKCKTAKLALVGASRPRAIKRDRSPKVQPAAVDHLDGRYGTEAVTVRQLIADEPDLGGRIVAELPYLLAEAVYAVRHEMALGLDDIFTRRTLIRYKQRDAAAAAARAVAERVAPELEWSAADIDHHVDAFVASIDHERAAGETPTGAGGTR